MQQYLSVKEVAKRYNISVPTVWLWAGIGPYSIKSFPKPVKLGPQISRWKLDELVKWEASRENAE